MDNTFVSDFLTWYQRRFGISEVQSNLELIELVQKAEKIHVQRIQEIEKTLRNFENFVENSRKIMEKAEKTSKIRNMTCKKPAVSKKKHVKILKY